MKFDIRLFCFFKLVVWLMSQISFFWNLLLMHWNRTPKRLDEIVRQPKQIGTTPLGSIYQVYVFNLITYGVHYALDWLSKNTWKYVYTYSTNFFTVPKISQKYLYYVITGLRFLPLLLLFCTVTVIFHKGQFLLNVFSFHLHDARKH